MRGRCPKDGSLIRLFMNETARLETEKLLSHLASCSRCAFRFDILRQVKRDLEPRLEAFVEGQNAGQAAGALKKVALLKAEASGPSASRRARVRWPVGMAFGPQIAFGLLAIIFVLSAGAYVFLTQVQRHADVRSQSIELILRAPLGAIPSVPESFRWTPVLNAEDYRLVLIDDSLSQVWSVSTFLMTEVAIPREVRAGLSRGKSYVWTVTARDGNGTLFSSRSGSFMIK